MVIQSSFCNFWIDFDSWSKCTNPTVFLYNPYLHYLTYLDFLLVSNLLFVSYIPQKGSFYYHYLIKLKVRGHIFVLLVLAEHSNMLAAGLYKFYGRSS